VNAVQKDNWTALAAAAWSRHVDVVKVLIQNRADVNLVNIRHEAPIDIAVLRAENDNDIHTVLYLFCIGRARITQKIRDISSHRFDNMLRLVKHIRSLHPQEDGSHRVFTQDERKFLYNIAFVMAIKCPGCGRKMFDSVLGLLSYNGCFMSRVFRLGNF